jgi:hypothetical protein
MTDNSSPRSRWRVFKYGPKRPMPHWRAVRDAELAFVEQEWERRQRQNLYHLQVAYAPLSVEWRLANADIAANLLNIYRARLIGDRLWSREVVRRRVNLMRAYPSWPGWKKLALLPFYNPLLIALDGHCVLPHLVRRATAPIPPYRHFVQARHFAPRP